MQRECLQKCQLSDKYRTRICSVVNFSSILQCQPLLIVWYVPWKASRRPSVLKSSVFIYGSASTLYSIDILSHCLSSQRLTYFVVSGGSFCCFMKHVASVSIFIEHFQIPEVSIDSDRLGVIDCVDCSNGIRFQLPLRFDHKHPSLLSSSRCAIALISVILSSC